MKINKNSATLQIAFIATAIAIISSMASFMGLFFNTETDINKPIPPISTGWVNTWNTTSGSTIVPPLWTSNTGNITNAELTFFEKLKRDYNSTIYSLPQQSKELTPWLSYSDRSQILIDYMTHNTIRIPRTTSDKSYVYIKLRKNPSYPIFIYWHNSEWPKSGDLELSKTIENISDTEYIFDTSAIPYKRYYDKKSDIYPWQSDINKWKSLYVAFASKWFDGNGIEQVIFYTKK